MTIQEHKKTVIQARRKVDMIENSIVDLSGQYAEETNALRRKPIFERLIAASRDHDSALERLKEDALSLALEMTNEDMK